MVSRLVGFSLAVEVQDWIESQNWNGERVTVALAAINSGRECVDGTTTAGEFKVEKLGSRSHGWPDIRKWSPVSKTTRSLAKRKRQKLGKSRVSGSFNQRGWGALRNRGQSRRSPAKVAIDGQGSAAHCGELGQAKPSPSSHWSSDFWDPGDITHCDS